MINHMMNTQMNPLKALVKSILEGKHLLRFEMNVKRKLIMLVSLILALELLKVFKSIVTLAPKR